MSETRIGEIVAMTLLVLCLVFSSIKMASAVEYTVGDSSGWSPNVESWTNGKIFRPDDVLVFKYDPKVHNVAEVNQASYDTCTLDEGSKIYQSGNDRITLPKGRFYFISHVGRDCNNKMKIEVGAFSHHKLN